MLLSKVHSYTDGGDCHARPTSTSGAVWGSISCPRTLQHRDEGSGTSDHPITRRWALPLSHSCPQTRQQIKATLLRNDTPVAVNLFKIHCNILSSRSWTEIEKFNKLQKTFSRFLKAEKVFFFFFFTSYTRLGPMISATSLHSSSWMALPNGYSVCQGQSDSLCTHQ